MTPHSRSLALVASLLMLVSCTTETVRVGPNAPPGSHDASSDSPSEAAASCNATVPGSCPMPVPSFANDVVPILADKCNGCHTGGDGPWPLTSYWDVFHWRTQILSELAACTMPPSSSTSQLTKGEQTKLIAWLVCDAPEN